MDGAAATMRRLVYIIGVTAAWQRYDESSDARSRIVEAHASGDANSVAELAQAQLDATGEDGQKPSFNHYLGWARFQRGDLGGARDAFLAAVEHDPHDARSWLHLGASLLSAFQIPAATAAFANANDAAIKTGDGATARDALAKLVKAKAWVADWAGFDYAVEAVAQDASSTEGLGVAHVAARLSHDVLRELARHQPHERRRLAGAAERLASQQNHQMHRRDLTDPGDALKQRLIAFEVPIAIDMVFDLFAQSFRFTL